MRVVLAEDSVLLREGLVRLLEEAGCTIVAAVGDGDALVDAVAEHRPDVAVVDVRMPPSFADEGLRAAIEARRRVPGTGVLVLSQYVEESYASDLLADGTGGVGYLLKDRVSALGELADALNRVAGGGTALDPEVVAQLFARHRRRPTGRADRARAGGARFYGRGPDELGYRPCPGHLRRRGREAHLVDPVRAGPGAVRERPPTRHGGPGLAEILNPC
jgi:DNA-binding NarL/FixJ family response regulator